MFAFRTSGVSHCPLSGTPSPRSLTLARGLGQSWGCCRGPRRGVSVYGSRFVFLSLPEFDEAGELTKSSLTWMLISPNNRRLGQAGSPFDTVGECRAAVL